MRVASGTSEREHGQPAALAWLLDGEHVELRAHIRKVMERPEIATFELPGCFAVTEAGHGSDVQATASWHATETIQTCRECCGGAGSISGPRCKAITREVNRLCDRVRGEAGELVDAFAIPDAVLGAPIGRREASG